MTRIGRNRRLNIAVSIGKSRWLRAIAVLLFLASLNVACTINQEKPPGGKPPAPGEVASGQAVPVQVVEVKEGRMALALSYTGDVKPKSQVNLLSKGMGRIEELTVDVGSTVRAGQVIGRLDRASLDAQMRQAEAAVAMAKAKLAQMETGTRAETIAQAQANLDSTREKLAAMEEGGRKETVTQAEAAFRLAEAKLAQLKAGPTPQQIEQAEAGLRAAKNQLYAAQSQADAYLGSRLVAVGGVVFTKEMKEAQSGAAYEQVKVAEARLAELKSGPTQEQLDQAQAAVDQSRAALEMAKKPFGDHDVRQVENAVTAAEQQLKMAQNPFTKSDFDVAQAGVAQAQANVDFVKSQIAETSIVAPIDGVIADKYVSIGALVSPQVPIVSIISSDLEIALSIEEARAGQIRLGQSVSVTVAAYPNESFAGTVSIVAPAIDPRSRTFATKVAIKDEKGLLKAGMLAKTSLTYDEKPSVLLAPEQAIGKRGTDNIAYVVVDGKVQMRKVELGAGDGQNVEIKSGLARGDRVVIGNAGLKDGDAVSVGGK